MLHFPSWLHSQNLMGVGGKQERNGREIRNEADGE